MSIKSDQIPDVVHDTLGRNALATQIANGISAYANKNKEGIALSITGEWGSGKTTLLDYIKKYFLQEEESFQLINFNPWMFFKDESIKEAFLTHLALSLKGTESQITKVSSKLTDLLKAFRWVKYVSATAGNIQEGLESVTTHLAEKLDVHEIKNEIDAILKKGKKKIIVFIDDVDRLMPSQVSELFQTITLVTNFSNIIYVVAFDRQIVIDAIGKDFSGKGQEYLEKIIQVDFEIPSIQDDRLEYMFYHQVRELTKTHKVSFDLKALKSLWSHHGLKDYFQNIRDFKRFFNSLSFRIPIIASDVNAVDFLVLEAIRIFDYESYIKFYKHFKVNTRRRELPEAGLTDDEFKTLKSTAVELIKAQSTKSTLHQYRQEANSKRLLDPAYFDRYFSLSRSNNDIGEKELGELITRPSVRKGILLEAITHDRIENLLKRLSDKSLQKYYPDYDFTLIKSLIDFFNEHPYLLDEHCDKVSDMLINLICGNKKRKDLLQAFFQSFARRISPPSLIHLYFFHYIRLFVKTDRYFRSDHKIFDEYYHKNYQYIEGLYLEIFKSAASNMVDTSLTDSWPFIKYLYQRNYAELFPEEYQTIFDTYLHDKKYLLYLVSQFVKLDPDDNSFRRYNWLNDESVFPGDNLLKFYKAVEKIAPESLDDREKALRHHFLAVDISNYPNIKYPEEPKMVMVG